MKINMQIKEIFLGLSVCTSVLYANEPEPSHKKPNFILILADDLGYGDIGCFGNKEIRTPCLDIMAEKGMVFFDFHSNGAASTPTRAALLTGRYQQRAGLEGVLLTGNEKHEKAGLQPGEVTFAKILQQNGYKTGIFGKWHLGKDTLYNPLNHGFDEFIGFTSGNIDYRNYRDARGNADWWEGKKPATGQGYATERITGHAIGFIERNTNTPFCLYIAHACPHFPYMGPDDEAYRIPGGGNQHQGPRQDRENAYREMIENMDMGIARILEALKKNNLVENTYIIFFSDNGPVGPGSSGGLRGNKGTLFEGGHRVPAIAFSPGNIPSGQIYREPVMSMDIFPTLMEWAGITYDPGRKKLDGVSLAGIFRGHSLSSRPLFWKNAGYKSARENGYKLVLEKQKGENGTGYHYYLFNLTEDPGEKEDIYPSNPEKAEYLETILSRWEQEVSSEVKEQL